MGTRRDDYKMFPDHEIFGKVAKIKRLEGGEEAQNPPGLKGVDDILTLYF